MIITRTCSYCGKKYDNLKLENEKNIYYSFNGYDVCYQIKNSYCSNCNRLLTFSSNYPLLNIILKTVVAYVHDEEKLIKKYITQINTELDKLPYLFGKLKKIDETKELADFIAQVNEMLLLYNKNARIVDKNFFFSSNIAITSENFEFKENTLKVGSIAKYLKIIQKFQKNNSFTWLRGHSNINYKLVPSIFRECDDKLYEVKVMRYFMQRAAAFTSKCPSEDDWIKWLPFMQHYELYTRLLDWTDSPLCALFFALDNKCNKVENDAVVFMFNPEKWNNEKQKEKNDYVKVSGIPILDISSNSKVNFIAKSAFKEFHMPFELYPIAVSTIRRHDRMYNQQANFTLHDSAIDMYKLCPEAFIKIIIPKRYKKKMREELMNMGIDKTTFFPELTALAEVTNQRIK